MTDDSGPKDQGIRDFETLFRAEDTALNGGGAVDAEFAKLLKVDGKSTDEPWVRFTTRDRFGIAFSGGGIRSATFNLGVLQTLAHKGWLEHVDYLSTVSGGGYIGGFWSSLRRKARLDAMAREPGAGNVDAARQPAPSVVEPIEILGRVRREAVREPQQIRHLRQFSRFLVPRFGLFRFETWAGVMAVVGGMVPTLLIAAAALVLFCSVIATISALLLTPTNAAFTTVIVASIVTGLIECQWLSQRRLNVAPYTVTLLGMSSLVVGGTAFLWLASDSAATMFQPSRPEADWLRYVLPRRWEWHESSSLKILLRPAAIFGLGAIFALSLRLFMSRCAPTKNGTTDCHFAVTRLVVWLTRSAATCLAIACMWEAARYFHDTTFSLGLSGLTSGGLFLALRDWLRAKPEDAHEPGVIAALFSWLKPLAPQALALFAVIAFVILGTAVFQSMVAPDNLACLAGGAALVLLAVGLFVDTSRVGLHEFYRRRIARAYLGAARAGGESPKTYLERDEDDFDITALADSPKPIHLVCCTANDVANESMLTMNRGGRSVALSPLAISIGNHWAKPENISLGAALTASGAAFNSQMGTLSVQFGDAVSLLMSTFNLRLGLWVPHPNAKPLKRARNAFKCAQNAFRPLLELVREATGNTSASYLLEGDAQREPQPPLHLSDGGHFENLGLYELVRRHCRYIVVSDAGADPDLAFDDLANAIRRVREDFSVEIEINVEPLRPRDGFSEQHVVIGTIHYDGLQGSDKGTLLYMKPTLVGSEPPDVRQYHQRNAAFPHEGTADQFYDEPQWESYRRLGEHVMAVALQVADADTQRTEANEQVDGATKPRKKAPVDALFLSLSKGWHAAPEHNSATFLAYTQRCSELESSMMEDPSWFRAEFFPELRAFGAPEEKPDVAGLAKAVTRLMQVCQIMEDVWLAAKLDLYWSHPLNEGWMTYFHRWANTPSFRQWWPLLRGIYSNGFRNFVRDRFNLSQQVGDEPDGEVTAPTLFFCTGKYVEAWEASAPHMGLPSNPEYRFAMKVTRGSLNEGFVIPVAALKATTHGTRSLVSWKADDLVVPPWLMGSGVLARFLDELVKTLGASCTLEVEMPPPMKRDTGSRTEHAQRLAFYKSRGFTYANEFATHLIRPATGKSF